VFAIPNRFHNPHWPVVRPISFSQIFNNGSDAAAADGLPHWPVIWPVGLSSFSQTLIRIVVTLTLILTLKPDPYPNPSHNPNPTYPSMSTEPYQTVLTQPMQQAFIVHPVIDMLSRIDSMDCYPGHFFLSMVVNWGSLFHDLWLVMGNSVKEWTSPLNYEINWTQSSFTPFCSKYVRVLKSE